jgi:hypothetical protein
MESDIGREQRLASTGQPINSGNAHLSILQLGSINLKLGTTLAANLRAAVMGISFITSLRQHFNWRFLVVSLLLARNK